MIGSRAKHRHPLPEFSDHPMNATSKSPVSPAAIAVPLVLVLCWALPRLVVRMTGIDGHWTPFLYQYVMGGLVFGIGLLVITRSGACDFSRPGDKNWFWVLVFGYAWYAAMHGLATWLAVAASCGGSSVPA